MKTLLSFFRRLSLSARLYVLIFLASLPLFWQTSENIQSRLREAQETSGELTTLHHLQQLNSFFWQIQMKRRDLLTGTSSLADSPAASPAHNREKFEDLALYFSETGTNREQWNDLRIELETIFRPDKTAPLERMFARQSKAAQGILDLDDRILIRSSLSGKGEKQENHLILVGLKFLPEIIEQDMRSLVLTRLILEKGAINENERSALNHTLERSSILSDEIDNRVSFVLSKDAALESELRESYEEYSVARGILVASLQNDFLETNGVTPQAVRINENAWSAIEKSNAFRTAIERIILESLYHRRASLRAGLVGSFVIALLAFALTLLLAVISIQYSRTFKKVESLTTELKDTNRGLEEQVKERTADLRIEVEERLLAQHEAERLASVKSEFLANMSHEIRTPMNAILGMAELLDGTELNREQKEYVQVFRRAGDSLLNILNDILDFSRIESGRFSIEYKPFSLQETIGVLDRTFRPGFEQKGLPLVIEASETLPRFIYGDSNRLFQVLSNLLSNALKFTTEGEVHLKIHEEMREELRIVFSVKDTGIGMTADQIAHLFTRFYQADSGMARRYRGSGLGLALSKQLVELMGGSFHVESVPDKGSLFAFDIRTKAHDGKDDVPVIAPAVIESDGPLCILAVDDTVENLFLVKKYLEPTPWKLFTAQSGEEALEIIDREHPHLILLDIQMPGMDGFAVLSELRRRTVDGQRTLVIALTGQALEEEKQRIAQAGFDRHLAKPVSRSGLIDAIRELLAAEEK